MPLRFASPTGEAYRYPLIIRQLLASVLDISREQVIVYRDRMELTYGDLATRISRLANMLCLQGVTMGTTVAFMDWDSHRYLEAYFAVPMMGAVLQTVNVRMPPAQIAFTLKDAEAEIVIVHHDFLPLLLPLLPQLSSIRAVIVIADGHEGPLPPEACGDYESLLAEASPIHHFEDFDEDAIATIFHTSGTTGDPKGVCFSHRQLVLHTLAVKAPFGTTNRSLSFGTGDVYMPLTPMFHVHAWGMPYVATMLGVKQIYPGRYDPDLICSLRARHGVTFSHCVPTVLQMLLDAAERTGTDLRGWNMTIGGSALSPALFDRAQSHGVDVFAGYGMSESGPAVAISIDAAESEDVDHSRSLRLAAGRPVPLVHARIVDADMRDVPHDDVTRGELVVRAPWLTQAYVNDENASKGLWRGGWLHTHDVATMSPDGVIRIRDRLKDVIKTGGEWLDSILLEELLASVPGVTEASVIAVPDAKWGERPMAIMILEAGATLDLDELNAPIDQAIRKGQISRFARIQRYAVVDQLPRTSVGKTDKKVLRAAHAGLGEE